MTLGASLITIDRQENTVPMIWFHSAPMDRRAGRGMRPISQVGCHDGACGEDGFTLLEIVCVLAIVAMLAALLLPKAPGGTSRPRLEAYALEAATVLRTDRIAALRRHVQI